MNGSASDITGRTRTRFQLAGRNGRATVFLFVTITLLGAAPADADWRSNNNVGDGVTVTDNVNLAPNGQKQGALVNTLTAGTQIRGSGERGNLAADYQLYQDTFFLTHGPDFRVRNYLAATGTLEAVPDLFFIDGQASANRYLVRNSAGLSLSPGSGSNQQTNVETVGVSPYLRKRFTNWSEGELRYRFQHAFIAGGDTTRNEGTGIVRADATDRLGLTGELDHDDIHVTGNLGSLTQSTAQAGGEFALIPQLALIGSAGWERITIKEDGGTISDPIWAAGFLVRPGPRSSFKATYGRRYGRQNVAATLRYQVTESTAIGARHIEQLESRNEYLFAADIARGTDAYGTIVDTRTNLPTLPLPRRSITDPGVFFVRSTDIYIEFPRASATYALDAFYDNLDAQTTGTTSETDTGVAGHWLQVIGARTRSVIDLVYRRSRPVGSSAVDTFLERLTLLYDLADNLSLSASYSRSDALSSVASSRYRENAVSLALTLGF